MMAAWFSVGLISTALTYLLNSIWQVPLVALAAWAIARMLKQAGPRVQHRVWVSALLVEVVLPACHFQLADLWRQIYTLVLPMWGGGAPDGRSRVVMGASEFTKSSGLHIPLSVLIVLLIAYACSLLYFAGRLAWALWKTAAARDEAMELPAEVTQRIAPGSAWNAVRFAVSPMVSGPSTVGLRRGVLLLPPGFVERVDQHDLDAALAHEWAHIRRHDFAKNLLFQIFSLPIAYHPALWFTRSRIAETREMVCDAMAAGSVQGRETYARSLLRLASLMTDRMPATTLHAIGMFDANNFERRVMNLTQKHVEMTGLRRLVVTAVCGAVALVTCGSAVALRVDVNASGVSSEASPAVDAVVYRVGKGVSAPLLIYSVDPEFPDAEKAKPMGFSGVCVVSLIVGNTGDVERASVLRSLAPDFDAAALEAARKYRFKPSMRHGQPVAVSVNIEVNFKKY